MHLRDLASCVTDAGDQGGGFYGYGVTGEGEHCSAAFVDVLEVGFDAEPAIGFFGDGCGFESPYGVIAYPEDNRIAWECTPKLQLGPGPMFGEVEIAWTGKGLSGKGCRGHPVHPECAYGVVVPCGDEIPDVCLRHQAQRRERERSFPIPISDLDTTFLPKPLPQHIQPRRGLVSVIPADVVNE